jgi:phosphomevalonate kinase
MEMNEEVEKKLIETTTVVRKIQETSEMELLQQIMRKLDALESRLGNIEGRLTPEEKDELLGDVDEKLIELIKKSGKACAEDVQREFNYRGKNAASARLNRLFSQGLLEKKQAGRKVYYLIKQ